LAFLAPASASDARAALSGATALTEPLA